jgi:hypothetical protein
MIKAMADVPGVAVTDQKNQMDTPRFLVGGKKPPVQSDSIRRPKIDILKRAAQFAAIRFHHSVWLINLMMFKPAQHRINNPSSEEPINPDSNRTLSM